MQKKLIALAIAGAFVAPAAFAESGNVTIYGVMSASYDLVDAGYDTTQNGGTASQRVNKVSDNSSRIGFKGTEDLGNGLAAVWQIESTIFPDAASNTTTLLGSSNGALNARNTFVGLSGKTWGTVILGRHDTPYKLSTRNLDMFADGIADNRSIMGQAMQGAVIGGTSAATFDGRASNVVAYVAPNMNGFSGAIAYVAGAEAAVTSGNKKGNAWSAMANYTNGPWYGALAYERHNLGTNATGTLANPFTGAARDLSDKSEKAWKLGVGYSANNFKVGFAYEKTSDDFGIPGLAAFNPKNSNDVFGHNAYYLSGAYMFGNNAVKLAYTRAGSRAGQDDSGAKQWALGLDHNFSKRTKIFALYTKMNNDKNGLYSLSGGSNGGTPNTTITAGGAATALNVGSSPSAWSFGMRHDF